MIQGHPPRLLAALVLAAAAMAPLAQAQEAAILKRATELRESPGSTGASLGTLAENSDVQRSGERKGSWIKVRTPQGTVGWVHMFDVGTRASASADSGNAATAGLRSLGNFLGGNSGTTTATSTVGIRGLGAEDIANARPNPAAVSQAEQQRVSADEARRFAGRAGLRPQQVAALPEPPRPTSPASTGERITPFNENISPN